MSGERNRREKIRVNIVHGTIETDFSGGTARDKEQLTNFVVSVIAIGGTGPRQDNSGAVAFYAPMKQNEITRNQLKYRAE